MTGKLQEVGFPALGDFLEERFVDPRIHALVPDGKIVGRAVTLRIVPPDATPMAEALDLLGPVDVPVVDTGQNLTHAPIGAVTGCVARAAGAAGVVVDGVVTDLRELPGIRREAEPLVRALEELTSAVGRTLLERGRRAGPAGGARSAGRGGETGGPCGGRGRAPAADGGGLSRPRGAAGTVAADDAGREPAVQLLVWWTRMCRPRPGPPNGCSRSWSAPPSKPHLRSSRRS
ncbi:hypothetical protein JK364_27340 [Streptomyces sp. 110]|uniref:Uncharacterized protein n=1 Tax=Streptomyces endocoffeicus TaxID=2898945 RepID=A0ABS1PUH3_9ACTN|nr:hypothetical protein [Streptomyces endocoffeicus]